MHDQSHRGFRHDPPGLAKRQSQGAPGKSPLTARLPACPKGEPRRAEPIQRKVADASSGAFKPAYGPAERQAYEQCIFGPHDNIPDLDAQPSAAVQARGADLDDSAAVHAAASVATSGTAGSLPHADHIQQAFGHHDISSVRAYSDDKAERGARAMGARAFATGDQIAFAGTPDLHTAAHEAAHAVQQRGGVQLKGGVGQKGDAYERNADQVADAVVRGESAQALLDPFAAAAGPAGTTVQRKVPDKEQEQVTLYGKKLALQLNLDPDDSAVLEILKSAIASCNSAQEAMQYLDLQLPTLATTSTDNDKQPEVNNNNNSSSNSKQDPHAALKVLVKECKYQKALNVLREMYRPGGSVEFHLKPTNDYSKVIPENEVVPSGIPFGVTVDGLAKNKKTPTVYIHEHWIKRWIQEDQIGSLINTIEHEAFHAQQMNEPSFKYRNYPDVLEFEAYADEILRTYTFRRGSKPLATQPQIKKAYESAKEHYENIETEQKDNQIFDSGDFKKWKKTWKEVNQIFPKLSKELDKIDEERKSSRFEEERFMKSYKEFMGICDELGELEQETVSQYSQPFRSLHSREGNVYREILRSHQELNDTAKKRHEQHLKNVHEGDENFSRYNLTGPSRFKNRKPRNNSNEKPDDLSTNVGLKFNSSFSNKNKNKDKDKNKNKNKDKDKDKDSSDRWFMGFDEDVKDLSTTTNNMNKSDGKPDNWFDVNFDDMDFKDLSTTTTTNNTNNNESDDPFANFGDPFTTTTSKKNDDDGFGDFLGLTSENNDKDENGGWNPFEE